MSFYQETKSMKGAVIGTIMPWSGALSEIPDGWIICDGSEPEARDFPLLVQAIGDTYNQGLSNLGGAFPAYTGNFVLPNLVDGKMLADIEIDYFQAGTNGRINLSSILPTDPDQDSDAGNIIGPLIGDNTDNGVPEVFNDVSTDIEFILNDRFGYSGKITGNTIIDGSGEKSVHIGGRKLGHGHIRSHTHSGNYETLTEFSPTRPGRGVVPYSNIQARFSYANFNEGPDEVDGVDANARDKSRFSLTWSKDNTELLRWDLQPSLLNIDSGFGEGDPSRVVAQVSSEAPPVNLYPSEVQYTPISNFEFYKQKVWAGGGSILYGPGGQPFTIPERFKNNYGRLTEEVGYFPTFVSNIGDAWLDDSIQAHAHDPFQVVFDQNSLKPQSRLSSVVNIPETTVLDNASNVSALQISMNTSQPSLTCVYIIRAY